MESVYWAPAVMEREDRLLRAAFPDRAGIWFSGMNWLTHRISNGSNLSLIPLALSGLARHVPGIPKIPLADAALGGQQLRRRHRVLPGHPHTREVYDAVHERFDDALRRLALRAPDAPLCVIAHSLSSVIASDHFYDPHKGHFYDPHKGRTVDPEASPLERGETLTFFYTLGSPIALWVERYGDFSRPVTIPGKNSKDPVVAASAEWINFSDPDDVLAFPLKGLSEDYDAAVDEDRAVSVGALVIGMSPVSHVAYWNDAAWNDAAVIRPIAQSLAWLWNALGEHGSSRAGENSMTSARHDTSESPPRAGAVGVPC